MERDLYAEGFAAGRKNGLNNAADFYDLLEQLSDFLDNYTDAETDADGHTHGNRAMGLKSRIDELL